MVQMEAENGYRRKITFNEDKLYFVKEVTHHHYEYKCLQIVEKNRNTGTDLKAAESI